MAEIDYQKILQKIDTLVKNKDEDMDYSGAATYRNKANLLRKWLKDGEQGDAPIDLGEFGVDFISSAAKKAQDKKPAEKTKESLTAKEDDMISLSPEERAVQEQLKEVREHIKTGRLRQAVALAGIVESQSAGDANLVAAELLEEALQKRDAAVDVALKKADAALKKVDKEQAKAHYETALEFNPDHDRAKSALRKIESESSGGNLSAQEINNLKSGLRNTKDIKRMGEAVYEAESLRDEGKLTKELLTLLEEGRTKYDQTRALHGDETTMMRMGDLSQREKAKNKIDERIAQGEKYFYDATQGKEISAVIMAVEALKSWETASADTAQYEITVIDNLLPARPDVANARLEKALLQPFAPNDKKLLSQKLDDINKYINLQKQAEDLLRKAAQEDNKIEAFSMVLKAQGVFPYLPILEGEIAQAQTKAIATTARKIEDAFLQARAMVGKADSIEARRMINDALELMNAWPHPEMPERLQSLDLEGKRLLEFDSRAFAIRKEAEDPRSVANAMKQLEELRKEARFADLPELRAFISEMDQYRDSGDQLREAREAQSRGEWQRVYELTTKIQKNTKSGNLSAEVDVLYAQAEREVRIEDAYSLLDSLEIKKANSILSQLKAIEKDEKQLALLEQRLAPAQLRIDDAIKNTPLFQPYFDHAVALRNGQVEQRLESLRIFSYLGNMVKEKPSTDLPDYTLTLRTADARKATVEVKAELLKKCMAPLQKAYSDDKRKKIEVDEIQHLANLAKIMREGNLTASYEENSLARRAEMEWSKHLAKAKAAEQDWAAVVELWSEFDAHYPGAEEALKELNHAREQQSITESVFNRIDQATSARDALIVINDALENPQTKHLADLKKRREQIFLKAQDDLLKIARESNFAATNEGKLNAYIALVDLSELEELSGLAKSRRRSEVELKNLDPAHFKDVADGIIQQANTFSAAQYSIEKALIVLGGLIARMQTFAKITPLFANNLFELDGRLERSKSELTITHQKLKGVQSLLDEALNPQLWSNAITSGSFDIFKLKRDAMLAQGLTSLTLIPDVKEFDQKVGETKEAYEHIKKQTVLIKQAFDVAEDFTQAVDLLRRLSTRPSEAWQVVSQMQYEDILKQMDDQFRVSNIYGGGKTLAGHAEITEEALRRDQQFEVWSAWERTTEMERLEALEMTIKVVNKYELLSSDVPINHQRRDWEKILVNAQAALDALSTPPDLMRDRILSKKALEIFDNSKAHIKLAEKWKHTAEQSIQTLSQKPGFPSPEEFNTIAKMNNPEALKNLIIQAERAGALAPDEIKRLDGYNLIYKNMLEASQKQKSWWNLG